MWLTPDPRYRAEDLAAVWRCAQNARLSTAVLMFHSSELMPGGSPFRKDDRSVRDLLACLEAFLAFVRQEGGEFVTLTHAARVVGSTALRTRSL
jgi:hypothetical protein